MRAVALRADAERHLKALAGDQAGVLAEGQIPPFGVRRPPRRDPFARALQYRAQRDRGEVNSGFVNVGTDHDTPAFAVTSIDAWWQRMGSKRYPDATELFITADAGGSDSYRARVWKFELQRLADKTRLPIHVSHFPPGTSKWNKVEHRLFSFT
jgi:hypothetical protein